MNSLPKFLFSRSASDTKTQIQMRIKGMGQAGDVIAKDFSFSFRDHQSPCTGFQAAFISPKISDFFREDPTLNSVILSSNRSFLSPKVPVLKFHQIICSFLLSLQHTLATLKSFKYFSGQISCQVKLAKSTSLSACSGKFDFTLR
jgi:hypothetical protein